MKIIVCGGRNYTDRKIVWSFLDELHKKSVISMVMHGDCRGADMLGKEWAKDRGVHHKAYPADWARLGKKAGPVRNGEMLKESPDIVVAFPGGPGTADMVGKAQKSGVAVYIVGG